MNPTLCSGWKGAPFAARPRSLVAAAFLALAACGGGGGSGDGARSSGGGGNGGSDAGGSDAGGSNAGASGSGWVPGVFEPASKFAARCAMPRTGAGFPDRQGTTLDENNWLRSWSNDLYLWYDEIIDRDPADFETLEYFDLLKTNETTASGRPKDRFHFTMDTEQYRRLSRAGESAGYGAIWAILAARPPRDIRVAFTEPGSPATEPGIDLARGARILEVDGVDAVNDDTPAAVDALNAALFPAGTGESHVFVVRDRGATETREITLTSVTVTSTPVQNVGVIDTDGGNVGYMLFNDHIAPSEQLLIDAVNELNDAGISDLMLDIRYNGGGFLDIANELAFMIAGEARTAGKAFETLQFNDKHPDVNPVTGAPLTPRPFLSEAVGFSAPDGQPLPALDLPRVFVVTGPGTCSASESVINALRGIDVEVLQIGATTCGKPFGFYPADNCGTTYFSIQFQGVNDKGFGGYPDGFSPSNEVGAPGVLLAGCSVADDFSRELGDPEEARLAAALTFRDSGTCPSPSSAFALKSATPSAAAQPPAEVVVGGPNRLSGKILAR